MVKLEITEATQNLYTKVKNTIIDSGMIGKGDKILAAVSGGPDSMAMLYILNSISSELGFKIGIGHMNHCLRGEESDGDAAFVNEIAIMLGIEIHMGKTDAEAYRIEHRLSPEEAAREVRFSFLFETMKTFGYDKIATAHNSDDNAELVMMNILRGTGPDGLEGMRPVAQDTGVIRPLLRIYRRDIDYLLENSDIPFRIDSSNDDENFLRNRVRKNLFPHIENRFNGKIKEALNRLSDIMAEENDFMDKEAERAFSDTVQIESPTLIRLNTPTLVSRHRAISRRVLRMAIKSLKGDLRRISQTHIDAILGLTDKDYDCELHIPGRLRVLKEKGIIYLKQEDHFLRYSAAIEDYRYFIDYLSELPVELFIPEAGIKIRVRNAEDGEAENEKLSGADRVFMEKESIALPIIIRNARLGDRFSPMGLNGTKTVMRFLMDLKIPELQRKKHPVMEYGGEILWVVGKRLSEKLKIKNSGSKMIVIETLSAN